ncbi:MAG: DUF6036 family nucleotidyltransferase [Candidatus Woesearchaeota archaeon]
MLYNKKEINANELFELLESISGHIERKISMYALGGTALTILGIKQSTLDIDINIDLESEYKYIKKIFEQIGFKKIGAYRWLTQESLAFDLFFGSNILGTNLLSDCLDKSKLIKSFGMINLYTLSLYDIIISKLARGDERDFNDIKNIFESEKIDVNKLIKRYKETMEDSIVGQYKQKLLDLIKIKFSQWKFPLNKELIEEVEKWPNQ